MFPHQLSFSAEDGAPRGGSVLLRYERLPLPRQPIIRVVITGGPCSGKTTGLLYFKKELERLGYVVFCLPEVATMLMRGGARLWLTEEESLMEQAQMRKEREKLRFRREYIRRCKSEGFSLDPAGGNQKGKGRKRSRRRSFMHHTEEEDDDEEEEEEGSRFSCCGPVCHSSSFSPSSPLLSPSCKEADQPSFMKELLQRRVLQTMLVHEDTFYDIASSLHQPVIVLTDRGSLDGAAYCTTHDWRRILLATNYTEEELVEARYNCVVHFVTAADGASSYYTLANNQTRHESIEEALRQDLQTRQAWRSFPFVMTIGNERSASFEDKIARALRGVLRLLPSPHGLSPRIWSMDQLRGGHLSEVLEREVWNALRHTGSIFFASTRVPHKSIGTPWREGAPKEDIEEEEEEEAGVQRFMIVEEVDWGVLQQGTQGIQPWVTVKEVSQFFVSPCEGRGGAEEEEVGENTELLTRIEGCVGVPSRPLYLRQVRVRPGSVPLPFMELRSSSVSSSTGMALKNEEEAAAAAAVAVAGEASVERGGGCRPPRAALAFKGFLHTCPLTPEAFFHQICAGIPLLPLVEKKVFRFFHGHLHLQVMQFSKGGWEDEETMQKVLRGEYVVIAGPAFLTPEMLPKWIKVSPAAYQQSWVSREIIM